MLLKKSDLADLLNLASVEFHEFLRYRFPATVPAAEALVGRGNMEATAPKTHDDNPWLVLAQSFWLGRCLFKTRREKSGEENRGEGRLDPSMLAAGGRIVATRYYLG